MLKFSKRLFSKNLGLKLTSLALALALWFYIANELSRGGSDEGQLMMNLLPAGGQAARKLTMRPIFVGEPRAGFSVAVDKAVVVPEYCIVVGTKELMGKLKYAYTMPIDLAGVSKPFTKDVALNPIAPGVFMEETLVQVMVPVEKTPGRTGFFLWRSSE